MSKPIRLLTPLKIELDVYDVCLKLTEYSMGVCKPKVTKDKLGKNRESPHHIPTRYNHIGQDLLGILFEIGGYILEANEIYVGANLNKEERKNNYLKRIEMEKYCLSKTYTIEHYIRVLNDHKPFADSTITYWIAQVVELRNKLKKWIDSDKGMCCKLCGG